MTPLLLLIALAAGGRSSCCCRPGWRLVAPALVLLFLAFSNREAQHFLAQAGTDSLNGGIQVQRTTGSTAPSATTPT